MKYCIVLASGVGSRFGADCPKQFVTVVGKMVVEYTLASCDIGLFDEIILVVSAPYVSEMTTVVQRNCYSTPVRVVTGGESRKESCQNGLAAINGHDGVVVIHNGVQPLVSRITFERCLKALEKYPAVTSGLPCVYTILETDETGVLRRLAPRSQCFGDLGPECFHLDVIRKALELGRNENQMTNLTGIVLKYKLGEIGVVEGELNNFKITYPEDIKRMERILREIQQ